MNTEPIDLLIAALCHAFLKVFKDRESIVITNEGHGREPWSDDIDLSRTVGWFTVLYPIAVSRGDGDSCSQVVRQIKDNRRKIANNGFSYFASRYLNEDGQRVFGHHDRLSEVVFNYHGRTQRDDGTESIIEEADFGGCAVAGDHGEDLAVDTIFDIGAIIADGAAQITFDYHGKSQHASRIESWAEQIATSLSEICHALDDAASTLTLSDLPLLGTDFSGLDMLLNGIIPQVPGGSIDNVEDAYPCSPMQDGILLSQIRQPDSYKTESLYEISITESGTGVEIDKLIRAYDTLTSRHSTLRTVFLRQ